MHSQLAGACRHLTAGSRNHRQRSAKAPMKAQRIIVLTAAIAALSVIPAGFSGRGASATAALFAQSPPSSGPVDPAALPAHDNHEGLLIAADPYTDPERSKQTFGKNDPAKGGVLPID